MNELPSLPPGYTVEADSAVGYSYLDETGNIILQHPYDDANARTMVWRIYQKRATVKPSAKKGK